MFGDRIMKAKAKKVEKEFTENLREKPKAIAKTIINSLLMNTAFFRIVSARL